METAKIYVVPSRRLTMMSIGAFSSEDFTVTASFTVGELSTGARSLICLLIAVTSARSSGCANSPASENLGLNSWTMSQSPELGMILSGWRSWTSRLAC